MEKNKYYKQASTEVLNIIIIVALIITGFIGLYKIALAILIVEVMYLLMVPNNKSYQSYIDYKKGSSNTNSLFKKSNRQLFNLPISIREKSQNLEKKYNQIIGKISKSNDLGFAYQDQVNKMGFLLDKYISFSETYANYDDYLKENDPKLISKEIINMKEKLKNMYDDLKGSNDLDSIHKRMESKTIIKSNLEILEKRLSKLKEIKNNSDILKIQLDNIEDSFHLVTDYMVTSNNSDMDFNVNKIIKDVEITESAIKNTQKEMNQIKKMDYN